jgi:hypothetical protein
LWALLTNKEEEPDVFLAYFTARRAIESYIKEGEFNDPDWGGDYTFPGHVE